VAIVQRFGGALNLNVHVHARVADGVFVCERGRTHFHRMPPAIPSAVARLHSAGSVNLVRSRRRACFGLNIQFTPLIVRIGLSSGKSNTISVVGIVLYRLKMSVLEDALLGFANVFGIETPARAGARQKCKRSTLGSQEA